MRAYALVPTSGHALAEAGKSDIKSYYVEIKILYD